MSDITISSIYKDAWQKLWGSKGSVWAIAIVIILVMVTIMAASNWIATQSSIVYYWLNHIISITILYGLVGPFWGASFMVAIKRFRQEDINIKTGYRCLNHYIMLAIATAIIGILSNLVSIVINIPSVAQSLGHTLPYFDLLSWVFSLLIYTFLLLSAPLIIDKNYSIGKAFSESFKKTKPHWLRIFAILFLAYLVLFIMYIPATIGLIIHNGWLTFLGGVFFVVTLIWFLPFLFLLAGNIYYRLIDRQSVALTD